VLTAAERIEARERELFEQLRGRVGAEVPRLQCAARAIAELDDGPTATRLLTVFPG